MDTSRLEIIRQCKKRLTKREQIKIYFQITPKPIDKYLLRGYNKGIKKGKENPKHQGEKT